MKFSGVTILQGVEFSIFPLIFQWVFQHRSATALYVINTVALVFHVVLSYIITADVSRSYLLSSFVLRQHSAAVQSADYF